jgi:cytochrome c-type biogenesis protein CcsB
VAQGHCPVATHYESLVIILFVALTVFVYLERRLQWSMLNVAFLGLASAVMLYSLTLARAVEPVLPVLRRPWVAFHVSLNVASYGLFTLSFLFGLLYLVQEYQLKRKRISFFYYLIPPLDRLEYYSAHLIKWGFPLLTAGIVAGSIYAHSVWGSFWDWHNVKETWSFLTWLIYAYYLYLRHGRGWVGRRAVLWAVFGFLAIVANYGVSLWVSTPHSFIQGVLK